MSKKRDGKHYSVKLLVFIVIVVLGLAFFFQKVNDGHTTDDYVQTASSTEQVLANTEPDPYDEIRSRENIKRQQELIVKETYLSEEKARVENEKKKAIEDFDSQLSNLETQLEEVRGEKLSFQ